MKTIEHDPRFPSWFNKFLNFLAVDREDVTAWSRAWMRYGRYWANTGDYYWRSKYGTVTGVPPQLTSQVWNAWWFVRVVFVKRWPAGFTVSHRPKGANYKHTLILGYKVNGRFALTLRLWHTDEASARGTTGPNYGQATGDTFGPA